MFGGRAPRYAVVSYESRRDLEDPMRLFQRLEVHHLYRKTPWNDMVAADLRETSQEYRSPVDLVRRLRRVQPDAVQSVEPFALITLPYSLAILGYVRASRVPLVLVSLENISVTSKYGPVGLIVRALVRPLIDRAVAIIYINDGARDNFLAGGADPGRMKRLLYGTWGVDLTEFRPGSSGRALRRTPAERVILFVGRVEKLKGIFDLLDAFESLTKTTSAPSRLVIAGDGSAMAEFRGSVASRGLEDVVDLLGTVKNREVADLMRAADVLVAPSVTTRMWAEQVGMVLLQAMACGIPVVSTTSGSVPEFVPDGVTGVLVPEGDPRAIAEAVGRILADDELRARFGAAGRRVAEERFDASVNAQLAEETVVAALKGAD